MYLFKIMTFLSDYLLTKFDTYTLESNSSILVRVIFHYN